MALSSHKTSNSVVEISESPLFHYQFSSLFKCIKKLSLPASRFALSEISLFCLSFLPERSCYILQLDVTPYIRSHSPTLEDRQYVKVPNTVIQGNKPIDIGYPVSALQVQGLEDSKWSLPVSLHRLQSDENSKEVGVLQLKSLLDKEDLPFNKADLLINTGDSEYGHASFLAPLYEYDQLVNVVRGKTGMKVYKYNPRSSTGGANGYKGAKVYLLRESQMRLAGAFPYFANSIFDDFEYDEFCEIEQTTQTGRQLRVELYRFNDFLLETKQGHKMTDKPVDIVVSEVFDAQSGKRVFGPLYRIISGQKRRQVSTQQAFQAYAHRYDIEPSFRFGKQDLKLDKYRTSQIENFDRWLLIYQLAYWLLFVASDEVSYQPVKWRKYKRENKAENRKKHLSPAQTRTGLESLLLKLDAKAFKPRASNKGGGREQGSTIPKKKRYKVTKKRKKPTKIDKKEQQNV